MLNLCKFYRTRQIKNFIKLRKRNSVENFLIYTKLYQFNYHL